MEIWTVMGIVFILYREVLGLCLALGAVYITRNLEQENAADRLAENARETRQTQDLTRRS